MSNASTYQVWKLSQKCTYLSLALTIAKEHMNKWTWKQCCDEAVLLLSKCGINLTSNARTVMEWYRQLKKNENLPYSYKKTSYLHFLSKTKTSQQQSNSITMNTSVSFLLDYLHKTVIPTMVKDMYG
jgi:hypothetical protein